MLPEPIGIDDVARLLGRSPDWLRRHLGELTRRHGFPRPLLPTGRMVWHPMAVEAWRLRHAPPELLRELADRLRAIQQRHQQAGRTPAALVIDDHTGRPFTRHTLSHRFARVRDEACRRHPDLAETMRHKTLSAARHTCVTWLAEAGCEIPQIAAITGHSIASVTQIIEHYLARTSTLADAAIAALERRLGSH